MVCIRNWNNGLKGCFPYTVTSIFALVDKEEFPENVKKELGSGISERAQQFSWFYLTFTCQKLGLWIGLEVILFRKPLKSIEKLQQRKYGEQGRTKLVN